MKLAHILGTAPNPDFGKPGAPAFVGAGVVHAEATATDAALIGSGGRPVFDIRDVSGVEGLAAGWTVDAGGAYSAPPAPPPPTTAQLMARAEACMGAVLAEA